MKNSEFNACHTKLLPEHIFNRSSEMGNVEIACNPNLDWGVPWEQIFSEEHAQIVHVALEGR